MAESTEWAAYFTSREQLHRLGLSKRLRDQFEAAGPAEAIPMMRELIAGGREAVARVNAADRLVSGG